MKKMPENDQNGFLELDLRGCSSSREEETGGTVRIGTIEPRHDLLENIWKKHHWTDWDKDEILAFLLGAFTKYPDSKKSEYTDMNQDLCDYVRRMLDIEEENE